MASDWNPPVVGSTTVKVETLAEMHARHAAEMARLTRPGAPTYAQLEARLAEAERLLRAVEWAGVASWGYELSGCPMCGAEAAESNASHGEGCALARWLEGGASK